MDRWLERALTKVRKHLQPSIENQIDTGGLHV